MISLKLKIFAKTALANYTSTNYSPERRNNAEE
jgi:hypothetical protein